MNLDYTFDNAAKSKYGTGDYETVKAETAVDINYLKAGLPVMFKKDKYSLFINLMSDSKTYFSLNAEKVRVKPMMVTLPCAQQNGAEVLDTDTWNTFSYKATRGY